MQVTNYDNCSYMENCELRCYHDDDLSQLLWEDNFEKITEYGHVFLYTPEEESLNVKYLPELYDFSKCTYRDYRKFCLSVCHTNAKATIREKFDFFDTWEEFAMEILNSISFSEKWPEIDNAIILFDKVKITGCSQDAYATIIYSVNPLREQNELCELFKKLFYDTPCYCCLTVDSEDYYLTEGLGDDSEWDIGKICTYAKTLGLSTAVLMWLASNLPENL